MSSPKEKDICIAFYQQVQYLIKINYFPKDLIVFHIANEQKTNLAYTMHLKRMGLLSGVPDYCCIAEGGKVCFIEFKRNTKCRLSNTQRAFMEKCTEFNIPYFVAYSEEDAIKFLHHILQ